MPNSVKCLLEAHEDMVKAMLVLQVFLTESSKIEHLLSCAPSCSEACLFFFDLLSLCFSLFRRILAWAYLDDWSDWWYSSFGIVVGCLSLGEWWSGIGHSPVCQILLQVMSYLSWLLLLPRPALKVLSTPADLPFFSDFTAASTVIVDWWRNI